MVSLKEMGKSDGKSLSAYAGWIAGTSDRCPNCGAELWAYESQVRVPPRGEVDQTYAGIQLIDVTFRGTCQECRTPFKFTGRYRYEMGNFDRDM